MTKEERKKMGRPPLENGYSAQMPRIRLTPDKLKAYKKAAKQAKKSLSEWVRSSLDSAIGDSNEKRK